MRIIYLVLLCWWSSQLLAQNTLSVSGLVKNEEGQALEGITIQVKGTTRSTTTNVKGEFVISHLDAAATLVLSGINTETMEFEVRGRSILQIILRMKTGMLDDVVVSVNTGYQKIPRERVTGSFVVLDSALLNRRVGPDILSRLEGLTSGLLVNRGRTAPDGDLGITIRGRGTLIANGSPLIILDNFPFEGDINSINPNDVESITVLKDAAAASIWGARSGNGVIVITTKKGKYGQPIKLEANVNTTFAPKTDLSDFRFHIPSEEFIELERMLFDLGHFNADINNRNTYPVLSPAVEIFRQQRSGELDAEDAEKKLAVLKAVDVRKEFMRHFYASPRHQQYAVNVRGGDRVHSYSLNLGYDHQQTSLVRNINNRFTIAATNNFRFLKNLELSTRIQYTRRRIDDHNRFAAPFNMTVGGKWGTRIYPYAQMADEEGNALAINRDYRRFYVEGKEDQGFLDWQYRPLDELALANRYTQTSSLLLTAQLSYSIRDFLQFHVGYQQERQQQLGFDEKVQESYDVRNAINQFSIIDPVTGAFNYQFPMGGILTINNNDLLSSNYRINATFHKTYGGKHELAAMAGAEIRETTAQGYGRVSYGYDSRIGVSSPTQNYLMPYQTQTRGMIRYTNIAGIPSLLGDVTETTQRFVSTFANFSYTYDRRYMLTGSARSDGGNIFGVKVNQRMVPLWHAGIGWNIHEEKFYHSRLIPVLRFRTTYGYNGNMFNGAAVLTALHMSGSYLTGLPFASILTPGNAELRWEKVGNLNMGLDFSTRKNRFSGTLEFYRKNAVDLVEQMPLSPSLGFGSVTANTATVKIKGMDLTLNSRLIDGKFKWINTVLFSIVQNRVHQYNREPTVTELTTATLGFSKRGKPQAGMYSYPFAGLDPTNGDPLGYIGKQPTSDYAALLINAHPDSLRYHGSSIPPYFGSFINTFEYKGFSLSVNITYKMGYVLRNTPMNLNAQTLISQPNIDYVNRWQKPGDEKFTNIPSVNHPLNARRNTFYAGSSAMIFRGDQIRLQYINLSYSFRPQLVQKWRLASLQVYGYINNPGIIWRANKIGRDPDAFNMPIQPSYSIGVRTSL